MDTASASRALVHDGQIQVQSKESNDPFSVSALGANVVSAAVPPLALGSLLFKAPAPQHHRSPSVQPQPTASLLQQTPNSSRSPRSRLTWNNHPSKVAPMTPNSLSPRQLASSSFVMPSPLLNAVAAPAASSSIVHTPASALTHSQTPQLQPQTVTKRHHRPTASHAWSTQLEPTTSSLLIPPPIQWNTDGVTPIESFQDEETKIVSSSSTPSRSDLQISTNLPPTTQVRLFVAASNNDASLSAQFQPSEQVVHDFITPLAPTRVEEGEEDEEPPSRQGLDDPPASLECLKHQADSTAIQLLPSLPLVSNFEISPALISSVSPDVQAKTRPQSAIAVAKENCSAASRRSTVCGSGHSASTSCFDLPSFNCDPLSHEEFSLPLSPRASLAFEEAMLELQTLDNSMDAYAKSSLNLAQQLSLPVEELWRIASNDSSASDMMLKPLAEEAISLHDVDLSAAVREDFERERLRLDHRRMQLTSQRQAHHERMQLALSHHAIENDFAQACHKEVRYARAELATRFAHSLKNEAQSLERAESALQASIEAKSACLKIVTHETLPSHALDRVSLQVEELLAQQLPEIPKAMVSSNASSSSSYVSEATTAVATASASVPTPDVSSQDSNVAHFLSRETQAAWQHLLHRVDAASQFASRHYWPVLNVRPQVLGVRIERLGAVGQKLPRGHYIMRASLFDRVGGTPVCWNQAPVHPSSSSVSCLGAARTRAQTHLSTYHQGRAFDHQLEFDARSRVLYLACPSPSLSVLALTLVIELVEIAHKSESGLTAAQREGRTVAWGMSPVYKPHAVATESAASASSALSSLTSNSAKGSHVDVKSTQQKSEEDKKKKKPEWRASCTLLQGSQTIPLLCGGIDRSIRTYDAFHASIGSDLETWLCNAHLTLFAHDRLYDEEYVHGVDVRAVPLMPSDAADDKDGTFVLRSPFEDGEHAPPCANNKQETILPSTGVDRDSYFDPHYAPLVDLVRSQDPELRAQLLRTDQGDQLEDYSVSENDALPGWQHVRLGDFMDRLAHWVPPISKPSSLSPFSTNSPTSCPSAVGYAVTAENRQLSVALIGKKRKGRIAKASASASSSSLSVAMRNDEVNDNLLQTLWLRAHIRWLMSWDFFLDLLSVRSLSSVAFAQQLVLWCAALWLSFSIHGVSEYLLAVNYVPSSFASVALQCSTFHCQLEFEIALKASVAPASSLPPSVSSSPDGIVLTPIAIEETLAVLLSVIGLTVNVIMFAFFTLCVRLARKLNCHQPLALDTLLLAYGLMSLLAWAVEIGIASTSSAASSSSTWLQNTGSSMALCLCLTLALLALQTAGLLSYLVHCLRDGSVSDLERRLMPSSINSRYFFTPHDHELSISQLRALMMEAIDFVGVNGERKNVTVKSFQRQGRANTRSITTSSSSAAASAASSTSSASSTIKTQYFVSIERSPLNDASHESEWLIERSFLIDEAGSVFELLTSGVHANLQDGLQAIQQLQAWTKNSQLATSLHAGGVNLTRKGSTLSFAIPLDEDQYLQSLLDNNKSIMTSRSPAGHGKQLNAAQLWKKLNLNRVAVVQRLLQQQQRAQQSQAL